MGKEKDTHYVQDPIFQENFLNDLQKLLPESHNSITIKDIDFSMAYRLADEEREMKEQEKERIQDPTKGAKEKYLSSQKDWSVKGSRPFTVKQ